jgi:hypothetical protein
LIQKQNYSQTFFRSESVEQAAEKNYKNFIEELLNYQKIFNKSGDLYNILQLPYPLFRDIVRAQHKRNIKDKNKPNSNQLTIPFDQQIPDLNT